MIFRALRDLCVRPAALRGGLSLEQLVSAQSFTDGALRRPSSPHCNGSAPPGPRGVRGKRVSGSIACGATPTRVAIQPSCQRRQTSAAEPGLLQAGDCPKFCVWQVVIRWTGVALS
jgi:hypothetical protein